MGHVLTRKDRHVTDPTTPPVYVDRDRCLAPGADPSFPDAVWITVVGPTAEDAGGPFARTLANRYAGRYYNDAGATVDQTFGPSPDDGSGPPAAAGGGLRKSLGGSPAPAAPSINTEGTLSVADYYRMAARTALKAGDAQTAGRFVTYYRVRRPAAMVGG
jgi:hypothetical protein